MQELARALAHLLEAERQERARAEAQEAEDQQARVLAQLLRAWSAPRSNDPALGLEDDPDAPAAQLARALLRARLDPAALAAQLVPGPVPAAALRPRPPVYDDGPTGPEAEDAGDETPDVDPELLRYPRKGWAGGGACIPGLWRGGGVGGRGAAGGGLPHSVLPTPRPWDPRREWGPPPKVLGSEVLGCGDSGERDCRSRARGGGGLRCPVAGGGVGGRETTVCALGGRDNGKAVGWRRPGPRAVWACRAVWALGQRRGRAGTASLPSSRALRQVLVGANPRGERRPRGCGCPAPPPPCR